MEYFSFCMHSGIFEALSPIHIAVCGHGHSPKVCISFPFFCSFVCVCVCAAWFLSLSQPHTYWEIRFKTEKSNVSTYEALYTPHYIHPIQHMLYCIDVKNRFFCLFQPNMYKRLLFDVIDVLCVCSAAVDPTLSFFIYVHFILDSL